MQVFRNIPLLPQQDCCEECGVLRYPEGYQQRQKLHVKGRRVIDLCKARKMPSKYLCRKCQLLLPQYHRVKRGKCLPYAMLPRDPATNIEKTKEHLPHIEFELDCRATMKGHDLMMDIFCERWITLADEVNLLFQEAHHLRGSKDPAYAEYSEYHNGTQNKNLAIGC